MKNSADDMILGAGIMSCFPPVILNLVIFSTAMELAFNRPRADGSY